MKLLLLVGLALITLFSGAQELSKKQLKEQKDSIAFSTVIQFTDLRQYTFNATEQEFLGSSLKLTRGEHYVTISGDSLFVFMPFPNVFDPTLITDTRNLQFSGMANNYIRKVNTKQKCITVKFRHKYMTTNWEFLLTIEKDNSSTLFIKTQEGATIKFIGETTAIKEEE